MKRPASTVRLAVSLAGVLLLTALGSMPAPAQQGGARGVVIEAETFAPNGAPSAAQREAPSVETGGDGASAAPGGAGGDGRAAARSGPGVELITGGRSTDGAAHVGRLPVLE